MSTQTTPTSHDAAAPTTPKEPACPLTLAALTRELAALARVPMQTELNELLLRLQPSADELRPHVGFRQSLLDRIAANTDDLYLMANPPSGDEVVAQRLLPNPIVVFARSDHPLAGQVNIPFARFAREPLLVRESGSGTRMTTDQLFRDRGIAPCIRMELGSNEAIREALTSGLGVSIMSRQLAGVDLDANLAVLDVEGFPVESYWYLVYPVGKQLSFIAQTFLDFVRKEALGLAAAPNNRLA